MCSFAHHTVLSGHCIATYPCDHAVALQVNVRELVCCDQPDQFGSVRAIPDFKVCFHRAGLWGMPPQTSALAMQLIQGRLGMVRRIQHMVEFHKVQIPTVHRLSGRGWVRAWRQWGMR